MTVFPTTQAQRNVERNVADLLARSWSCEVHAFPRLSPVDWYLARGARLVGVAELKGRNIGAEDRALAYMDVHKWFALSYASLAFGVPGVYVVAFTDAVRWCYVDGVDPRRVQVVGRRDRGVASDVHPAIAIPVPDMHGVDVVPL